MDNSLAIIDHLGKNKDRGYTMHELSALLNIPYATFYRTVLRMKELLLIETVGKAKIIRLNLGNPVIKAHLTVASDEAKQDYLKKQPIIRKLAGELHTKDTVVLFGSYAKGKETEKSDIDLLIINKNGKKSLSFSKYELLFRKRINPIFVTQKEFKKMLQDKEENVGKQALRNHIILNNQENFWRLVLDGV